MDMGGEEKMRRRRGVQDGLVPGGRWKTDESVRRWVKG